MTSSQGGEGFARKVATALGGDKTRPIGLISLAGNRGSNAQQVLREAGFTHVYNIREGMAGSRARPGWVARGLPLEACPGC
jgi:rhodanese-related sulfurtransferase